MSKAKTDVAVMELPLECERMEIRLLGVGGKTKEYVLVELDGNGRDEYLNEMNKRMKTIGKETKISNYKGLQSMLVSMCMRHKADMEPVLLDECQALPGKTLTKLFETCQSLNGLDDKAKDAAKND